MDRETVIPVVSEQVEAGTRKAITGAVRVHKTVDERRETVERSVAEDCVEIERVVRNQRVDGPQTIRQEGDTTIIPVVKQVPRIELDWILTEEIHVTRRRETRAVRQPVTLLEEHAEVKREDF